MKIDELITLCDQAIARGVDAPLLLVIPRQSLPSGRHVRLLGKRGPMGRICNVRGGENDSVDICASFKPSAVKEFVEREMNEQDQDT